MRKLMIAAMTLVSVAAPALAAAQEIDRRDGYEHRDDRRDGDRRDGDRRDGRPGYERRDGDRRDGDRHDGDRRDGYRQDGYRHDGDRRDERRIERFDAGRYYAPRGYAYRSWAVGGFFPRAYYDQRFWIADPFAYRLPPVPYRGARWVRYGPDALLVRIRDGYVIQVVPNRFY